MTMNECICDCHERLLPGLHCSTCDPYEPTNGVEWWADCYPQWKGDK